MNLIEKVVAVVAELSNYMRGSLRGKISSFFQKNLVFLKKVLMFSPPSLNAEHLDSKICVISKCVVSLTLCDRYTKGGLNRTNKSMKIVTVSLPV